MPRRTMAVAPYGRRLLVTVAYGDDWIELDEIVVLKGGEDITDDEVDAAVAAADARLRASCVEG